MIRFVCATCNRSLRAPARLAGKRGRCARCGEVNLVPAPALSVDVARAPAPSPFRSTADLAARNAIEGTMELDGARFLATSPLATPITEHPDDLLEQFTPQISEMIEETFSYYAEPPMPRSAPIARVEPSHHAIERHPPRVASHALPFDASSADFRRAILGALVVGAVAGFCLGLVVAKWVF